MIGDFLAFSSKTALRIHPNLDPNLLEGVQWNHPVRWSVSQLVSLWSVFEYLRDRSLVFANFGPW